MLTPCINRNVLKIAALAMACVGLTAVPARQSTHAVAANRSSHVTPKANCNARADKLNALLEATAPVTP